MIDGWTTTTPHSNYHRHCSHARQAFLAIANGLSAFRSFIGLKHGGGLRWQEAVEGGGDSD